MSETSSNHASTHRKSRRRTVGKVAGLALAGVALAGGFAVVNPAHADAYIGPGNHFVRISTHSGVAYSMRVDQVMDAPDGATKTTTLWNVGQNYWGAHRINFNWNGQSGHLHVTGSAVNWSGQNTGYIDTTVGLDRDQCFLVKAADGHIQYSGGGAGCTDK